MKKGNRNDYDDSMYEPEEDWNNDEEPAKRRKSELKERDPETIDENSGEEYFANRELWQNIMNDVKSGDPKKKKLAENRAVLELEDWIKKIASAKFSTFAGRDWEELVQEGRISVFKHLPEYDQDKGQPSTYFFKHIYHDMLVLTQNNCHMSRHYSDMANKIKRINRKLQQIDGQAQHTALQIHAASEGTLPLSTIINTLEQMNAVITASLDVMPTTVPDTAEAPDSDLLHKEQRDTIKKAMLYELTPKEAEVLSRTCGFGDYDRQFKKEIAAAMNISQEEVRALLISAKRKLKKSSILAEEAKNYSPKKKRYVAPIPEMPKIEVTTNNFFFISHDDEEGNKKNA